MTRLFAVHIVGYNVLELSSTAFIATTLGIYALPCLIMASVPKDAVNGVFAYTLDMTGALPTGFACFLLPSAIYLSAFNDSRSTLWYFAIGTFLLGLFLIIVCPTISTMTFVSACQSIDGCSAY